MLGAAVCLALWTAEAYNPQVTINAANNLLSSQSLAGSASVSATLDLTGVGATGTGTAAGNFEAIVQVKDTGGGSVTSGSSLLVQVFNAAGATPVVDTVPFLQFNIATVASTASYQSFTLPTGRWVITLTNGDASNSVTVGMTTTVINEILSNP